MGKFDGYLICTDLDGTFTSGHNIFGENAEFVKYFQENGGLFTVSTGRLPEHIRGFKNFKPNCPIISHNGAVIYDIESDKPLYKKAMPQDFMELYEYSEKSEISFRSVAFNGLKDIVNTPQNNVNEFNEDCYKVVLVLDDPDVALNIRNDLEKKFGDKYDIFMGWKLGIECLAKNANKGTAVQKLKEILGDKVKKVICVGDSESDTFMFKCADIGYAVENASDVAKTLADRVTVHCADGAIAQIIRDIENEL